MTGLSQVALVFTGTAEHSYTHLSPQMAKEEHPKLHSGERNFPREKRGDTGRNRGSHSVVLGWAGVLAPEARAASTWPPTLQAENQAVEEKKEDHLLSSQDWLTSGAS